MSPRTCDWYMVSPHAVHRLSQADTRAGIHHRVLGALCVSLTARPPQTVAPPTFRTPVDLGKLPMPPADHQLACRDDPNHIGELRLPPRSGPHPVVVLVHGGC